MSKEFTMSKYVNEKDLYKAKAEYYEELYNNLKAVMVFTGSVKYDQEKQEYYYTHSGESLDE